MYDLTHQCISRTFTAVNNESYSSVSQAKTTVTVLTLMPLI